jgi:hypothetical protein
MTAKLDIPDDLKHSFQRILRRIPHEIRDDSGFLDTAVVYLKLGGERLARQWIEVAKARRRLELNLMRKIRREEAMIRAATAEEVEEQEEAAQDENGDADGEEDHEGEDGEKRDENDKTLDVDSLNEIADDDFKAKPSLGTSDDFS